MLIKPCLVCDRRKVSSCFSPAEETDDGLCFVCDRCIRTNNEVWKPVVNWDNYRVSNLGRVQSLPVFRKAGRAGMRWSKLKILTPNVCNFRATVSLYQYGYTSNPAGVVGSTVLVLTAFLRPPRDGEEARHFLDPTVTNNRLENLRWGTHTQNVQDEVRHYGKHHCKGKPRSLETRTKIGEGNRQSWARKKALDVLFGSP